MIGLLLALAGLACLVYTMFIIVIMLAGSIVIVWELLSAAGRRLILRFDKSPRLPADRTRSRGGQPYTERSRSDPKWTNAVGVSGVGAARSAVVPNIGNDIRIIAGDQTPGMALYSEIDPPPHSKLAEN
jgi:hypothetical protein